MCGPSGPRGARRTMSYYSGHAHGMNGRVPCPSHPCVWSTCSPRPISWPPAQSLRVPLLVMTGSIHLQKLSPQGQFD